MYERRWPVIMAIIVGVVVVAALGWVVGHSSAPGGAAEAQGQRATSGPIRSIEGVPVGVQRDRAGALAAADNYVAVGSETVLQDPDRYATLVRQTYAATYQRTAIREAQAARKRMSELVSQYAAGRRGVALVAARRLDEYTSDKAKVTTWTAGVSWGPGRPAGQRWYFTETALILDGDRWRVEEIDESKRSAPTPGVVRYSDKASLEQEAFDRGLEGMTAPAYGAEGT